MVSRISLQVKWQHFGCYIYIWFACCTEVNLRSAHTKNNSASTHKWNPGNTNTESVCCTGKKMLIPDDQSPDACSNTATWCACSVPTAVDGPEPGWAAGMASVILQCCYKGSVFKQNHLNMSAHICNSWLLQKHFTGVCKIKYLTPEKSWHVIAWN